MNRRFHAAAITRGPSATDVAYEDALQRVGELGAVRLNEISRRAAAPPPPPGRRGPPRSGGDWSPPPPSSSSSSPAHRRTQVAPSSPQPGAVHRWEDDDDASLLLEQSLERINSREMEGLDHQQQQQDDDNSIDAGEAKFRSPSPAQSNAERILTRPAYVTRQAAYEQTFASVDRQSGSMGVIGLPGLRAGLSRLGLGNGQRGGKSTSSGFARQQLKQVNRGRPELGVDAFCAICHELESQARIDALDVEIQKANLNGSAAEIEGYMENMARMRSQQCRLGVLAALLGLAVIVLVIVVTRQDTAG